MKKSVFLSLLAGVLLSANAGAQVFNHLSLGVGGGTDGLSFELAAPLGGHVQVRAGYGTALGLIGYTVQGVSVPENPVGASGTMTQVPMKINLGMSDARLLFNIYPGKGGFHFTLGVHAGAAATRIDKAAIVRACSCKGTANTATATTAAALTILAIA